jgi:hypothetical protein
MMCLGSERYLIVRVTWYGDLLFSAIFGSSLSVLVF